MSNLFRLILTQPMFNALVVLYSYVTFEDLGLAIIILTILIRVILYPLFYKGLRNQMLMQRVQPEMKELQVKYKNDKEKQAQEMLQLWKKYDVNPFMGFLMLLVQLPIIFAIFHVFRSGITNETLGAHLYSFLPAPETVNTISLGFIDLSQPNMIILVLAVVASYLQSKLAIARRKDENRELTKAEKTSQKMVFIAPAIIAIFLLNLSAAIGLYILTTSVFSIFQQVIINKKLETERVALNATTKLA
ncbi:MAG: hypothetical protein COU09_02530 [Candidatus Harrisonbacteria bacterium CG10_big_fil_rev_8_21_14_0_10_44_23]|uniref:Membrane insertase YidC/Oxa/ALB C-terminal domain-containing protein n=1 Tax=Candidatus Harrisonbacteria bacterium CG10_big_fil_rev_8_21_14_0_10_44_23 TaxID=1974585 RepID=A0A2H0URU9_9BACT|nr:MAG: hypothetical protein COU09_02530 [Candidatus Harrisonbacteria bacterium CG10_big_fil_rev_8_21_14_0_10_44_23]